MIKKQYALILVLAVMLFSCAKSKQLVDPAKPLDKSLLWEISGNDLKQPSYLYGTIHIIGKDDYFLPPGTLSAFDKSDEVVFEIDMNEMSKMTDMSDISGAMSVLNDLFMKDNLTLKDLLTKEEYTQVKNHFSEKGLPLFFFERMKPMFLTVFASDDMDPTGLQTGALKSYEFEFMEMAKQSAKPMSGLETIEFQISIFDKIPYKDQAKMLVESLNSSDDTGGEMEKMTQMYKDQDIASMVKMIQSEEAGLSDHEDVLLTERNINWIPIMSEKMKGNTVFFAVGAGHLGGNKGVVKLLQKAGYTLKPLSAK